MVRLGLVIRALRRRKGWRQLDLARAAHVSQSQVSRIERGHGDSVTGEVLRRVVGAVEGRLIVDVRWRGGEIERLLDAGHARLVDAIAAHLRIAGWDVRVEVTYETFRASGSIDVLAWHAATCTLLVIEVKTEVTSAEATLRKLDEKERLASAVAANRFGWRAVSVSRLLVLEASSTNRRRIATHGSLFDGALPVRDDAVRRWIRSPSVAMAGRLFVSASRPATGISVGGGRHRVRVSRASGRPGGSSTIRPDGADPAVDSPRAGAVVLG